MGFSIGSFLGKIAAPLIGAAGSALGFPIAGRVLGAGVSAGLSGGGGGGVALPPETPLQVRARRSASGLPLLSPAAFAAATGTSVGPQFPSVGQFGLGATSLLARGIGATGVIGLIASLFATSRERTGQPINRKKVAAAVRVCGISMAAEMFQLSELEICQIVISKGRRRGRGISAADLRRTRSTLRKVHNIQHDLGRVKAVRRHHK